MINKRSRTIGLIVLTLWFLAVSNGKAQNVVRNGNVFYEQKTITKEPQKTGYIFHDKKGDKYPIYLSSNGKAFIIKTSQKTGKQYRKYLPEITEKLGTDKTKKGGTKCYQQNQKSK